MRELISPAQSETLVLLVSLLLALALGACGARATGRRGWLAALVGPLVFGAWQAHKYATRFDPQSGYFGLNKVSVLLGEVVVFVLAGALLGFIWRKVTTNGHE